MSHDSVGVLTELDADFTAGMEATPTERGTEDNSLSCRGRGEGEGEATRSASLGCDAVCLSSCGVEAVDVWGDLGEGWSLGEGARGRGGRGGGA
jgi:hypothetical protein